MESVPSLLSLVIFMEKNNIKILFVTEKWCEGNPSMGLTNNYHNLFGSLENCNFKNIEFSIVHIDEYSLLKKQHIDNFLPKFCVTYKPDVIIFSLLGKSPLNPTAKSYKAIKDLNIKTIFMWPDMRPDWGIAEVEDLEKENFSDLHVCWGSEKIIPTQHGDKIMWMWAPQDDSLYKPVKEQDIPVSFIGSTRHYERQVYLSQLIKNGVQIFLDGGQREKGLTPEQYASYIGRSKISINFPASDVGDQCKGRVWEILSSRSMMLERKNEATKKMLTPGHDYIEYENVEDLQNKITYYLNNPEERDRIALQGHLTYKDKYTASHFWKKTLGAIGYEI